MQIKNLVGQVNPYDKNKVQGSETRADVGKQAAKTSQEAGTNADKVQLSSEAKLRGAAYKEALEAPDVRRKKIDELKERVRNGTYKPDIKKAAVNLIRDDLDLIR